MPDSNDQPTPVTEPAVSNPRIDPPSDTSWVTMDLIEKGRDVPDIEFS